MTNLSEPPSVIELVEKYVLPKNSKRIIVDGQFAETKELIAGY